MLWDISLHIAQGRDEGPLANVGALLHPRRAVRRLRVAASCRCACRWRSRRVRGADRRRLVRAAGRRADRGRGAFSLIGFPLDDVWHRLFGQDVTLWGPTHLMLIGGAAMTLVGLAVLLVEAGAANREAGRRGELPWARFMRRISLPGRVPARAVDVPGRVRLRRPAVPDGLRADADRCSPRASRWSPRGSGWAAARRSGAALFFLALRGLMALLVGPVLGEPTAALPALLVEAAAGRADRAAGAPAAAAGAGRGRRDRDRRPRRRVGLDARVHAAAVARRPGARGRAARAWRWRSPARCVGAWLGRAVERGPDAVAARRRRGRAVAIFALIGYGLRLERRSGRARDGARRRRRNAVVRVDAVGATTPTG